MGGRWDQSFDYVGGFISRSKIELHWCWLFFYFYFIFYFIYFFWGEGGGFKSNSIGGPYLLNSVGGPYNHDNFFSYYLKKKQH